MPRVDVVTVVNEIGLHARPAARLVQALQKFRCDVYLEKDGEKINAKSIIGVLTLAAGPGTELKVHVDGPDEEACLAWIKDFFADHFGERNGGA